MQGSEAYPFADDLKLFKAIHKEEDSKILQEDINRCQTWAQTSLLEFHPDKCKFMHIGKTPVPHQPYMLANTPLKQVTEEKDIGVTIDSQLSFDAHICSKINKANQMLGIINRTFEYKDSTMMATLFKCLVRPHLEYANQAWSPYLMKHVKAIERVQKRATRMIPGMKGKEYEERLRELKLPTLKYRRLRGDMIELFKIVKNINDPEVTQDLIQFRTDTNTRGHSLKIYKKRPRLDIRKHSFFNRTVDIWNSLPQNVINADSVITFESRLDKHWRNLPLRYDHQDRTNPAHAKTVSKTKDLASEATQA
jgi:hypothetical protein